VFHSTLAIFLETRYQAKWQPVAGFEEHPMLPTFAVSQRAYPQTIYQLIMHDQATIPQAWQPIILLVAIAPQPSLDGIVQVHRPEHKHSTDSMPSTDKEN
jgi:hypothetical protein